mmetsp:Transcript_114965/g.199302  ORF Transcript_114965/g.199302 Transcript_114965/m.199302 type:complete len:1118 (-) Transcript_114965:59-3412(-)
MASELAAVLRSLQSVDNAQRGNAERQYQALKASQPAMVVGSLLQVLAASEFEPPVREQAAVLLRQCLARARDQDSIWWQLGGPGVQAEVKGKMLELLSVEPQDSLRRKVADCVQSLGNQLIDVPEGQRPQNAEAWPELLPALLASICDSASRSPGQRADALWAMKEMACSIWPMLVNGAAQTVGVLQGCMNDPADIVRANAAVLFCDLAGQLENKSDRQPFLPLVPELFRVMAQLASNGAGSSQALQKLLQVLQEGGFLLWMIKDHISSHVLQTLSPIAKSHPDDDVRKLALEALLSLTESSPKIMLKAAGCSQAVLDVCLCFLLELDNDVNAWAAEAEEGAEDEDHHTFGRSAMYRFCGSAQKAGSFNQVFADLQPGLQQIFQDSGNWKGLVAGLAILTRIAEYIDEQAVAEQMVAVARAQLRSENARVRYMAWCALTQLVEDQTEAVTKEGQAPELLAEVLTGFSDPCPRTVLACMGFFQNYGSQLEREDLEVATQALMEKLGEKLQNPMPILQREAITCMAAIAGQVKSSFAKYYPDLMPVLKKVIESAVHKAEQRTLLGKAFECISLLAGAVGRATFRADAEVIMQAMIQATQMPDMPKDDPVLEYMMAAAERLCNTLEEDFLPFVPHLLPMILAKLQLAPKELGGAQDDIGGNETVGFSVVRGEDGKPKVFIMSTSELEDLQHALECINAIVTKLRKHFGPFIPQTAQALLPVFEFTMNETIRDLTFETWGELCGSARDGGDASVLAQLCQEFMKRVVPGLEAGDASVDALTTRALGVSKCLNKAGPGILSNEQVRHMGQLGLKLIRASFQEREALKAKAAKAGVSELDDTGLSGEDEEEEWDMLRSCATEMSIALMKHHADPFTAEALPAYLPVVHELIQPTACESDRQLAGHMASGIFQHLGERCSAAWPGFLPQVLQDMLDPSADVRGTACFAASMAARVPAFAPHAVEAGQRAVQLLAQTRGRERKKSEKSAQGAADNALSALLEVLMNHKETVAAAGGKVPELWDAWLNGLPCQEDHSEGLRNTKALLQLAQRLEPGVLGDGGRNVPRVLLLLVDAYMAEYVDDETSAGIRQFLCGLGEEQLTKGAAQFNPKQKKKLQRIMQEDVCR